MCPESVQRRIQSFCSHLHLDIRHYSTRYQVLETSPPETLFPKASRYRRQPQLYPTLPHVGATSRRSFCRILTVVQIPGRYLAGVAACRSFRRTNRHCSDDSPKTIFRLKLTGSMELWAEQTRKLSSDSTCQPNQQSSPWSGISNILPTGNPQASTVGKQSSYP